MGDLLEAMSGGRYPATRHRVRVPEQELRRRTSRQSIVFFVHPDDEVVGLIYLYISSYLRVGGVRAPGQPGAGPPLPPGHRQAAPREQIRCHLRGQDTVNSVISDFTVLSIGNLHKA